MIRGTTPKHIFKIPIDHTLIKEVKIVYSQEEAEKLVKRTEDCVISEGEISTRLTQEDTFLFEEGVFVRIQMRVLTNTGDVLATKPITVAVGCCLDDEVLA